MKRQHCPLASLLRHLGSHLRNKAGAILLLALLVSLARPALKEACADGEPPKDIDVQQLLDYLRTAKNDFVTVRKQLSLFNFADRGEMNRQIDCLDKADPGLAHLLIDDPKARIGFDDPNVVRINNCVRAGKKIIDSFKGFMSGKTSDQVQAITLNSQQLQDLTRCTITITGPPSPVEAFTSDKNPIINITATIPLGSKGSAANILLDGTVVGALFYQEKGDFWGSSQFHLDGTGKTAGKTSTIKVTGTRVVDPGDGTPLVTATCTSTNAVTVNWKAPPKPVITKFGALPEEIEPPTVKTSVLGWAITDADTASINQGVGDVNAKTGAKAVSPEKETIYTLTAKGPGGDAEPKTVTVKVKKQPPPPVYAITLSSGGNDRTIADQVTVGGKVTPTPPQGTIESVTIGLNGNPIKTVPVAGDGSFFATVALENKTTSADLQLTNNGLTVKACGAASSPILLQNTKSAVATQNVINAAVLAPGGGAASNTVTLAIFHGAKVTKVNITWSGQCPGPTENQPSGYELFAGNLVQIGTVHCGVPCPGNGTNCTATASTTVSTSVGEFSTSALWVIDIP